MEYLALTLCSKNIFTFYEADFITLLDAYKLCILKYILYILTLLIIFTIFPNSPSSQIYVTRSKVLCCHDLSIISNGVGAGETFQFYPSVRASQHETSQHPRCSINTCYQYSHHCSLHIGVNVSRRSRSTPTPES